jgi:hypothetical protein
MTISIDAAEAIEIVETLQWLQDWFTADLQLGVSLQRYSYGLMTLADLHATLDRFAVALTGPQS